MDSSASFGERVLEIDSRHEGLAEVRRFADEVGRDFGLNESGCYELRLALTEAVTNAIRHASESEEDPIEVRAIAEEGGLAFYVKDSGTFVPRMKVPRHLPEGGRGMAFMGELMDDVEVRPEVDGTVVRLLKRPSS